MRRTILLIALFCLALILVTAAYSQDNLEQNLNDQTVNEPGDTCGSGAQNEPSELAKQQNTATGTDLCGAYSGYIQGVCCCDPKTGQLGCQDNRLCREALQPNR